MNEYERAIRRLRKLEGEQRQLAYLQSEGWRGAPQAALEHKRKANARELTALHIALAFCRNRKRALPQRWSHLPWAWPQVVANKVFRLSWGTSRNVDTIEAEYRHWAAWATGCKTITKVDRDRGEMTYEPTTRPSMAPWQVAFRKREKAPKKARRKAQHEAVQTVGAVP